MNWYIGQNIVCIDSNGATTLATNIHSGLKEGKVYEILGLTKGCCYTRIDVGISAIRPNQHCSICKNITPTNGIWWFNENRFRPLDELADISELTELLETTKPFEV